MMPDRRLVDFLDLLDLPPTSVGRTNLFIRISLLHAIQIADTKKQTGPPQIPGCASSARQPVVLVSAVNQ
jgi:hypothetical protein